MLNARIVEIYGYVAIVIMAIMLGLIWFEKVPQSYYVTMFLVAAALFLIRITLRLILARQQKALKEEQGPKDNTDLPPKA